MNDIKSKNSLPNKSKSSHTDGVQVDISKIVILVNIHIREMNLDQ